MVAELRMCPFVFVKGVVVIVGHEPAYVGSVVLVGGASFVGRVAQLEDLCGLLETRSLVTIVGEGGVGKTRLAREVAHTIAAADWPVWWTDLGGASGPSGVRSSFEDSLRPVGRVVSFEELIRERVPAGRCLMVIDNCEHVLDDIVSRVQLLGSVRPEMRVLTTSRIRLGVSGEVAYRLAPLDVPDQDTPFERVGDVPSVVLLIDRVRDVVSGFEPDESNVSYLASIARDTEGVPLAIELVAAAAGVLPLSEIARDVGASLGMGAAARREPRRHRSLDASVNWSVERLDPSAGVALRRLGVFAESFRFDTAVQVVSDGGDRHDRGAARSIVELVEASLVRRLDDDRFSLPMAVRTLAVEQLDASDEVAEVRDRHADAVADVIVEVMACLRAAEDTNEEWLRLVDCELPEIRAAIGWQLHRGRPERAADLVEEAFDHAHIRGRYGEVFAQCRGILAHPDLDRGAGATLAATASLVSVMAGRLADSHDFAVRAVSDADDPVALANAHLQRAWSGFFSGLTDRATLWSDVDETLRIAHEQRDDELHAVALVRQGSLVVQAGSIPVGRAMLTSVEASDLLSSHQLLAARLFETYGVGVFDLELDVTYSQVLNVIADCRSAGHIAFESMALATAATITALRGDEDRTDHFLDEAERLVREHELPTFRNLVQRWRAFAHYRFDRPDTAEQAQLAVTLAEATDNAWDAAAAHWLLGLVTLLNDGDGAVEHLHTSLDLSTEPGYPFSRIRAELALALVDLRDDQFAAGVDRVHDALRRASDHGDLLGVAASFDHLALFECERAALERSGRFAGAADRIHSQSSVERLPCERELRIGVERGLVDQAGRDVAARLVAAGRAHNTPAAVQLARRSRGRRGRPVSGWSSLTPTESEVADLAASGLSNSAIAERLVMSVNTVKTHLSHVYAKTGAAGRSALAAEWAHRPHAK
jgi:predicted ATPase/DNA-binding CsgD family transcriptional regulator